MFFRRCLLMTALLSMGATASADEAMTPAVGEPAPDFTIQGIDGKTFTLSDRLGDGERNVVLLFSRAHW